jgi:hypothetical protein
MPGKTYPYTVDTIGKLIDERSRMYAHCNNLACLHHAEVDLYELAYRFGRDMRFIGPKFEAMFTCSVCGSRDVAVKSVPDYSRMGKSE